MISVVIPRLPDAKYDWMTKICRESYRKFVSKDVQIIEVAKNQSFAKNVNEGLRQVVMDTIIVSNNDVVALPGLGEWASKFKKEPFLFSLTNRPDCGWGFGVSKETLSTIGYLDEGLENSFDDYDYFIRCALNGIPRMLAPKPLAIHEGGTTLRDLYGSWKDMSKERMELASKNRSFMLKKWPGVPISEAPFRHFVEHGIEFMEEWRKSKGVGKDYGRISN